MVIVPALSVSSLILDQSDCAMGCANEPARLMQVRNANQASAHEWPNPRARMPPIRECRNLRISYAGRARDRTGGHRLHLELMRGEGARSRRESGLESTIALAIMQYLGRPAASWAAGSCRGTRLLRVTADARSAAAHRHQSDQSASVRYNGAPG